MGEMVGKWLLYCLFKKVRVKMKMKGPGKADLVATCMAGN